MVYKNYSFKGQFHSQTIITWIFGKTVYLQSISPFDWIEEDKGKLEEKSRRILSLSVKSPTGESRLQNNMEGVEGGGMAGAVAEGEGEEVWASNLKRKLL